MSRPPLPEARLRGDGARRRSCAALLEAFPGRVSLACSFQKEEAVLLDMLLARRPRGARLRARHPRALPRDLRASGARSSAATGSTVEVFEGPSLPRQAAVHGEALWEREPGALLRDPQGRSARARARRPRRAGSPACAATSRRRAPARPSSAGTPTTSSGRRTRSPTGTTPAASPTSPSAGFPYNPLHDRGYASIGCTHCTLPAAVARAAGPASRRPSADCTADAVAASAEVTRA